MVLHCASRLGLLSTLYTHRQEIAYRFGLINELPIASCTSDYDFNKGLSIQSHDDDAGVALFLTASEIKLFAIDIHQHMGRNPFVLTAQHHSAAVSLQYTSPMLSVFHPPS